MLSSNYGAAYNLQQQLKQLTDLLTNSHQCYPYLKNMNKSKLDFIVKQTSEFHVRYVLFKQLCSW